MPEPPAVGLHNIGTRNKLGFLELRLSAVIFIPGSSNVGSRKLTCPQCKNVLKTISHAPKIGPGKVQCADCGAILNTNFDNWNTKSLFRKIIAGLIELLAPSLWPFPIVGIYISLLFCGIIGLIFSSLTLYSAAIVLICLFIGSYYVRSRIIESENYNLSQIPPKWGVKLTQKACNRCGQLNRSDRQLCEKCLAPLNQGSWISVCIYIIGGIMLAVTETHYHLYGIPGLFAIGGIILIWMGFRQAYRIVRSK